MNIIVTYDGSDEALRVLAHAARFARAATAKTYLLRVLNPWVDVADVYAAKRADAVREVRNRWTAEMAQVLAEAGIDGEPLVEELLQAEDLCDAIIRAAHEKEAALIAMHSRGSGFLRQAILGNVAMGVLGRTVIPVMVTGQHAEPPSTAETLYHILATSDGSVASHSVVVTLMPLLGALHARLTLLHISELRSGRADPQGELDAAQRQLETMRGVIGDKVEVDLRSEPARQSEKVPDAIVRVAEEVAADVIALASHHQAQWRRLVGGSVALDLLGKSPRPLILTHYGEK